MFAKIKETLFKPVFIITFLTLASKVLGFVRDILTDHKVDRLSSDLLLNANTVSEYLSTFLLMGTIYSSVLPIASKYDSQEKQNVDLSKYLNLVTLVLSVVLMFFSVLAFVFAEPILRFLTSPKLWSLAEERGLIDNYILTSRILLISPFSFAIQSVIGVFLTLKKRFTVFAFAGSIANIGTIIGLLASQGGFLEIAVGMVFGGIVATLIYLLEAVNFGYILTSFYSNIVELFTKPKPDNLKINSENTTSSELIAVTNPQENTIAASLDTDELLPDTKDVKPTMSPKTAWDFWVDIKKTLSLSLPRIFIIDPFYISISVLGMLAQSEGQKTAFNLGANIQGAFFVLVTASSTVIFPSLAKFVQDKNFDKKEFWQKLDRYELLSVWLGLGITVVSIIGSPVIVFIFKLFGRGNNEPNYLILLSQIMAFGILYRSLREILIKYFYVKQSQWQPVLLSAFGTSLQILAMVSLIFFYQIDAAIAASIGWIIHNMAWYFLAKFYIIQDKKELQIAS